MSGGSLDYLYSKLEYSVVDIPDRGNPLRKAFKKHLQLVARALHDIEWVDSGDYSQGDEEEAIKACLPDYQKLVLEALIEDGDNLMAALSEALAEAKKETQ